MKRLISYVLAAALPAGVTCAEPAQWYLGANLASYHLCDHALPTCDYDEINLGAFVTVVMNPEDDWQWGLQAGGYRNSYGDFTTYAAAFQNVRLFDAGPYEVRAGSFLGFFDYGPAFAAKAQAHNWPTLGDYILAGGLNVKLRHEHYDFTVSYLPADKVQALTFQISIPLRVTKER